MEKNNCAYFGKGLTFQQIYGCAGQIRFQRRQPGVHREAEEVSWMPEMICYQTAGAGQGGSRAAAAPSAYILANYGMEVIDSGVAVQNMHAPYEVTSKVDIYEARRGL